MNDDDLFGVMDNETDDFAGDDPFASEPEQEGDTAPVESIPVTGGLEPVAEEPVTQEPVAQAEPVAPPVAEVLQPAPVTPAPETIVPDAEVKPAAPRKKPQGNKAPAADKRARKQLTPRDKAIRVIKRRAGVEDIPTLDHLLRNKGGKAMRICDIGLFVGKPEDEILNDIFTDAQIPNRVNLSAEVVMNQVKKVGAQVLQAGRMYQPIQVARIEEDGAFECTSGRHRLAFLALLYGAKSNIKVYVEDMSLQEARDAVVVANMARPTKALERAEHAVLQAVHGDVNALQDELFKATATTKSRARKYCVYSVLKNQHPLDLSFKLSLTASRQGGALTTITNVENFWGASLDWNKDMERAEFDGQLKKSVEFLNALTEAMQAVPNFDAVQHMSSMALSAVGKYYRDLEAVTGKGIDHASDIAKVIVEMGEIGRQKSEVTYSELAKALRK